MAALLYADDMALMAPSLKGLQTLLDVCGSFCRDWDICLNPKKTKNMAFGKKTAKLCPLFLDGNCLEWVLQWKYLGVMLRSHKRFDCCIEEKLRNFYKCLNAILRIDGRSDEIVMLRLLEAHCLPILTYAIDVIVVSDRDKNRKLRVAYNAIFRKVFSYRYFESVRELQGCLGRPTWEELVERRKECFLSKLRLTRTCASNFL